LSGVDAAYRKRPTHQLGTLSQTAFFGRSSGFVREFGFNVFEQRRGRDCERQEWFVEVSGIVHSGSCDCAELARRSDCLSAIVGLLGHCPPAARAPGASNALQERAEFFPLQVFYPSLEANAFRADLWALTREGCDVDCRPYYLGYTW